MNKILEQLRELEKSSSAAKSREQLVADLLRSFATEIGILRNRQDAVENHTHNTAVGLMPERKYSAQHYWASTFVSPDVNTTFTSNQFLTLVRRIIEDKP